MNEPIHVASVLLVASKPRRRRLLPWLGVVGEPVAYTLEERDASQECFVVRIDAGRRSRWRATGLLIGGFVLGSATLR